MSFEFIYTEYNKEYLEVDSTDAFPLEIFLLKDKYPSVKGDMYEANFIKHNNHFLVEYVSKRTDDRIRGDCYRNKDWFSLITLEDIAKKFNVDEVKIVPKLCW